MLIFKNCEANASSVLSKVRVSPKLLSESAERMVRSISRLPSHHCLFDLSSAIAKYDYLFAENGLVAYKNGKLFFEEVR